ncbi:hypothetical protein GGS20DRAFT_570962 [Poronia punctata]|nr:hypothetical protein GGS20DRAFT_570962 [Poronia punctata]
MALFRPTSGPGGLSINTSSANMFGSAGGQSSGPGNLFGSTANTNTGASTPKPSGLFGGASSSATTNTIGTGTGIGTSQPQQNTGIFGASSQTQPQQGAQGASVFGGNQTQPQQTQPTGGLFGTTNATAQSNVGMTAGAGMGTGGSIFGSVSNTAQPAISTTGNPFQGQTSQQKPSVFGGLVQQASAQPSGFGQLQQQPSLGLGGTLNFGLTMGQPNTQPSVPGVRIDVSNLKGTTRFNDLQEGLQKIIEQADEFIQEQQRRKGEVDAFMSGHRELLESLPPDVSHVARKYDGARNALESAAESIEAARLLINQDADNARLSFRAIDNLKLPQQYHTSGFWSPRQQASGNANAESDGQDLVGFFSQAADDMANQMRKYERNLTEIELHMHGVSDGLVEQLQRTMAAKNGGSPGTDERIQELVAVLRDFEQGILKVANDVGSAREGMTRLQLGDFMSHDHNTNSVL